MLNLTILSGRRLLLPPGLNAIIFGLLASLVPYVCRLVNLVTYTRHGRDASSTIIEF